MKSKFITMNIINIVINVVKISLHPRDSCGISFDIDYTHLHIYIYIY